MTTFGTFDDIPLAPGADIELAAADHARQHCRKRHWSPDDGPHYCEKCGVIYDAKVRSWDNGDADPLHATMWEDFCPRCGIEVLTVQEYIVSLQMEIELAKEEAK